MESKTNFERKKKWGRQKNGEQKNGDCPKHPYGLIHFHERRTHEREKQTTCNIGSRRVCDDANFLIGETGMVDNFDVSLSSSFIRKMMKLELSETSKLSTIPVSPIMSLFNQFSTRSLISSRHSNPLVSFCSEKPLFLLFIWSWQRVRSENRLVVTPCLMSMYIPVLLPCSPLTQTHHPNDGGFCTTNIGQTLDIFFRFTDQC